MRLSRLLLIALLAGLAAAPAAEAAVSVSRAELNGQRLRVEGRGAVANAQMFVDGTGMGNADGSGSFRIERGHSVERTMKPTFTKPAPADVRREIAERCDAVIEALAD